MAARKKPEARVASAALVAATAAPGNPKEWARAIEAAMVRAIEEATKAGITDPAVIKEQMMAARQQVLNGG
jgi:hypothetical protein